MQIVVALATCLVGLAHPTLLHAATISIDGDLSDWQQVTSAWSVPREYQDGTDSPLGAVARVWVTHDSTYLYFRADFVEPRPWAQDKTFEKFVEGYWANMRYIQIDADLDGVADHYTNQTAGARPGFNNTYVVRVIQTEGARKAKTYLWYEGHGSWPKNGPRGHFSPDSRSIEIRVPYSLDEAEAAGKAVFLPEKRVGLQGFMSYRDRPQGSNKWVSERYPADQEWLIYSLADGELTVRGQPVTSSVRLNLPQLPDVRVPDAKLIETGDFTLNKGGAPTQETLVRVGYDGERLRVVFRCAESEMTRLKAEVQGRDGPVHRDDCVELFIDVNHDRRTVYHLTVNSKGVINDAYRVGGSFSRPEWDCPIEVTTHAGEGYWQADLLIPLLGAFGVFPQPGEVWGVNFARERYAGPSEYSTWAPLYGSFLQPKQFGTVRFLGGSREPTKLEIEVSTRGWLTLDGNNAGENVFRARVTNPGTQAADVVARVTRQEPGKPEVITRRRAAVPPEGSVELSVGYDVTDEDKQRVVFEVLTGEDVLYRNVYPAQKSRFPRVFEVTDPLYKELLSSQPYGLARDGVIFWSFGRDMGKMRLFAQQYGLRYLYQEMLDLYARHKLLVLDNSYTLTTDYYGMPEEHRKRGTRGLLSPKAPGEPADPANAKTYLDDVRDTLTDHRDLIWGIYAGDEAQERQCARIPKRWTDNVDDDDWIKQADRTVRERYGFGKYGLPKSDDKDPFRWIAFHRWLNDEMHGLAGRLKQLRDENWPEMKLISWDPTASVKGFDYGRYADVFDIVTHQLYPSRDPNRCEFGYITKVLVDLTSVDGGRRPGPEIWPCAHVEHYGGAFTPDEVREYFSQVFRNGGLGLHLYLGDTIGRSAGKGSTMFCYYGSPPRWRAMMQTVDALRTANRPRRPDFPNAAVLISTDTQNSGPGEGLVLNEIETLYSFLGPWARRWFLFIDDNQIERRDRNLADFKTVFVPRLTYERKTVVQKLEEYVRGGGELVIFDPEVFSWYTDGTPATEVRERLCGVRVSGRLNPRALIQGEASLPLYGPAKELTLTGAKLRATFDSGEPAVTVNTLGKGQVQTWATNPLRSKALGSPQWRAHFRDLAEELELPKADLWRFKLPPYEDVAPEPQPGVCLTNNYVLWDNNEPLQVSNLDTSGTYTYSLPPDQWKDDGGGTDVAFSEGDLTDRREAPTAGDCFTSNKALRKRAPSITSWAARWKRTDAFDLVFDFRSTHALDRIRLFYSGQLPAITVFGSSDGAAWTRVGQADKRERTVDVPDLTIAGLTGSYRYVRLSFGPRDEGQYLVLAEVEVWGKR